MNKSDMMKCEKMQKCHAKGSMNLVVPRSHKERVLQKLTSELVLKVK